MKDFPQVSAELIKALRKAYPDTLRSVESLEGLRFKQGQQDLIDFLEGVHEQQISKRSKS